MTTTLTTSTSTDDAPEVGLTQTEQKQEMQPTQGYQVPARTLVSKIEHYPANVKTDILAFYRIMKDENLSYRSAAALVSHKGKSLNHATLTQILNGRYEKPGAVVKSMAQYTKIYTDAKADLASPYIETRVSKKLIQRCKLAARTNRPLFIIGDPSAGKTSALKRFQKEWKKGRVYYTSICAGISPTNQIGDIDQAVTGSRSKSILHCREDLMSVLTADDVLIVDELHTLFSCYTETAAMKVWEFIRFLQYEIGFTPIFSGTKVLSDKMNRSAFKAIMSQVVVRALPTFALSREVRFGQDKATQKEALNIAAGFGLIDPPEVVRVPTGSQKSIEVFPLTDMCNLMIQSACVGPLFDVMKLAQEIHANGSSLTWDHFAAALITD